MHGVRRGESRHRDDNENRDRNLGKTRTYSECRRWICYIHRRGHEDEVRRQHRNSYEIVWNDDDRDDGLSSWVPQQIEEELHQSYWPVERRVENASESRL